MPWRCGLGIGHKNGLQITEDLLVRLRSATTQSRFLLEISRWAEIFCEEQFDTFQGKYISGIVNAHM